MRIPILVGLVGKKSEFYMENILKVDTVVGKKHTFEGTTAFLKGRTPLTPGLFYLLILFKFVAHGFGSAYQIRIRI